KETVQYFLPIPGIGFSYLLERILRLDDVFSRFLVDQYNLDAPKRPGGNQICVRVTQAGQPMDLHRFWDGVITSSQNLTRLRNKTTALRNRQEFQRNQLTELANSDFEAWAKESFEIAKRSLTVTVD